MKERVTLGEVNRNVTNLALRIETMARDFVTITVWEEFQKTLHESQRGTGQRIGTVEERVAEIRGERRSASQSFVTNFLYPLLLLTIGIGLGVWLRGARG